MNKLACLITVFFASLMFISASGDKIRDKQGPGLSNLGESLEMNYEGKVKRDIKYGKIPLYFIFNKGQVNEKAKFYAKASRYTLWLTKKGLVFDSSRKVEAEVEESHTNPFTHSRHSAKIERDVSRLMFIGANKNPELVSLDKAKLKVNYFIGKNKSKWHCNIPTSMAVLYKKLYKNIDLKVYGIEKQIEYDWIVKPGGNPGEIRFEYKNVKGTRIDDEGNLLIESDFGELMHKKPVSYQEISMGHGAWGMEKQKRIKVEVNFKQISENTYGFEVEAYDKSRDLIIDPVVLAYSTYLGGGSGDSGGGIAVDGSGNAYVTGQTSSTDFPTLNPYQTYQGNGDVFVTKLNTTGNSLLYSTYLGGGGSNESGYGIAVDGSGNAYVTGSTLSTNFPTLNPYQGDPWDDNYDAFVTKLNATGDSLLYSTYLGGGSYDEGSGIAVDGSGNAYVTGYTSSTNFPTLNPYQTYQGYYDAFVTKLNATGDSLLYSTYLGGGSFEFGYGIAVDGSGNAYVTGYTSSTNFPTLNPYQTHQGGYDAFVTKLDTTQSGASSLLYSTYLGGGSSDFGGGIAVDGSGNAYVTGTTESTDFPTLNQYQGDPWDDYYDAFITKLDPTQSDADSLLYSTYLGGGRSEMGNEIAVDGSGNAYVTGLTYSTDFPTLNPYQTDQGGSDAFITKIVHPISPTVTTAEISDITSTSASGGGNVISDGGSSVTARGVCWSTSPNPTVTDNYTLNGSGTGVFTSLITGLTQVTTYYVRAYATNIIGTAYGNTVSFTTHTIPTVTTSPVTILSSTTATGGGNVTHDGGALVTARGVCWSILPNPTISDSHTDDGAGTGEFVSAITGLTPGTFYYLRAYATNSAGTAYGSNVTFTLPPNLPTVTTTAVTAITATSAASGGNVTDDGGSAVTEKGICWSTSPSPSISDTHTTDGIGIGAFTSTMTGLSPDTQYFVRAYATNSHGTAYGLEQVFTTGGAKPAVTTSPVTMTGPTTASGGGDVTFEGASPVTARGVCWGRSPDPDITTNSYTIDGSGTGIFTSTLTGLIPGATYYVRAYATNDHGTNYGSNVTFTVSTTVPVVTTAEITNVTSTTASGGGNVENEGGAPVTAKGVCWSTSGTPTISDNCTLDGTGRGAFTSFITGLSPLTTYNVRAYATNSNGTEYGNIVSFTTTDMPDAPIVTTEPVTGIRIDSAICGGIVRDEGKSPVTSRGVAWSTLPGDETPAFHTSDDVGIGPFTSLLTGLTEGQTYYVRAYATNTYGTSYGEEFSFIPTATIPTVTTSWVTVTSATTAKGGGEVTDDGGTEVTARGVCWTTTPSPTISDNHTINGTGTGAFTSSLTGLAEGVTYYVRAYATNQKGTAYGSQQTFTAGEPTPSGPPKLSVSRRQMNFTVMLDGTKVDTKTGSQRFFIVNTGGGTLEWTASTSDNWINVSPSSGIGDALVSVSINPTGLTIGENTGSIFISAPEAEGSPITVRINLRVDYNSKETPPTGSFDTPLQGSRVSGSIPVTGWAIDDVEVTAVTISRDPVPGEGNSRVYIGDAVFVEGARQDVEVLYAGYPNNSTAGWGYMLLTHFLPNGGNGTFTLHVEAMDTAGHKTLLGSKTIVCDNANAIKPFGAIDTPAQGGMASGTAFINWGWTLTPQPNDIPTDGSFISVFVNGINLGTPTYNIYRNDVAQLFPGYVNSNGAGGYFSLDTTAFTTGVHTIAWQVRDSAGNTEGIGSRYFIILNSGTSGSSSTSSQSDYRDIPRVPSPIDNQAESMLHRSTYLFLRNGWRNLDRAQRKVTPDNNNGIFYIETRELEPLEVVPSPGTKYTGACMLVNRQNRPLPPGAGLDFQTNTFLWMPGPGFIGSYTFILTGYRTDGKTIRDQITIMIKPKYNYKL